VPRQAEFSLDVRDSDPAILKTLMDTIYRYLAELVRRRGLQFEFDLLSDIAPINNDPAICKMIDEMSSGLGINHTRMSSGAAHDTQIMATRTRTGLIFVPSVGGASHTPAEWTDWQDIFNGANVLLNTLFQLANE
jgi:N-carbamoyl-L-amino-acid hydrolase